MRIAPLIIAIGIAAIVLLRFHWSTLRGNSGNDFASCRLGVRREERGCFGLRTVVTQDGEAYIDVFSRERVRCTDPAAGQEFVYLELIDEFRERITGRQTCFVIVQYHLKSLDVGQIAQDPGANIVMEFRSDRDPFTRVAVPAAMTDGWQSAVFSIHGGQFGRSRRKEYSRQAMDADFRISAQTAESIVAVSFREVAVVLDG